MGSPLLVGPRSQLLLIYVHVHDHCTICDNNDIITKDFSLLRHIRATLSRDQSFDHAYRHATLKYATLHALRSSAGLVAMLRKKKTPSAAPEGSKSSVSAATTRPSQPQQKPQQQPSSSSDPASMAAKLPPRESSDSERKGPARAKGFFKRAPTMVGLRVPAAEAKRLQEDCERAKNWKRWGPYLSERQWATVREDYSPDGSW